jgi:hypothetical protein
VAPQLAPRNAGLAGNPKFDVLGMVARLAAAEVSGTGGIQLGLHFGELANLCSGVLFRRV